MTTKLVMRVAASTAPILQADTLPFTTENTSQLFIAGRLGTGVASYEEAQDLDIPFTTAKPLLGGHKPLSSGQNLHHGAVIDRACKALCRYYERASEPVPSDIQLESMATRALSHVAEQIKRHGLFVDTQKLLFSPRFEPIAMKILAGMFSPHAHASDDGVDGKSTASGAIGVALIPPPPSRDLKGHLDFLGPKRMICSHFMRESLASWVAENRPVLIEFPPPDLEASRPSRIDSHWQNGQQMSSELGLGFVLVAESGFADNYNVVTPFLIHRQTVGGSHADWRAEYLTMGVSPIADEMKKLRRLLKEKKYQPAQLHVCKACGEIYSHDRADLNRRCTCAQ